MVILVKDFIAISFTRFQNQLVIQPIATQAFHSISFAFRHQFLREEARFMTNRAQQSTTKDIIRISNSEFLVRHAINILQIRFINLGDYSLVSHLDDPLITHFSSKIIQHRELFQGRVPPIYRAVFLIDTFTGDFNVFSFVVNGIGSHNNLGFLVLNGGVANALQMLISDAAIVVGDFVVPFRSHEDETVCTKDRITIVFKWL